MKTRMLRVPVVGTLAGEGRIVPPRHPPPARRRGVRRRPPALGLGRPRGAGRHHRPPGLRDRPLARGRAARRRRCARRGARRRGAAVPRPRRPHPGAHRGRARRPDHARARRPRRGRAARRRHRSVRLGADRHRSIAPARPLRRPHRRRPRPAHAPARARRSSAAAARSSWCSPAPSTTASRRSSTPPSATPSSTTTSSAWRHRARRHPARHRAGRPCASPRRRPTRSGRWRAFPPSSSSTWPAAAPSSRRAASPVQEVITDGQDGLLFEPGDEMDLARQTRPPARRRAPARALAEAGYDRVRARHPASATRRRLLEAYARLLPPSQWAPPAAGRVAHRRLALAPRHHDRRAAPCPETVPLDGRAAGEKSGEIHISDGSRRAISRSVAGEIVIEIEAPPPGEDLLARRPRGSLPRRRRRHRPFVAVSTPLGFDDDDADEKTKQRPLRPKKTSG